MHRPPTSETPDATRRSSVQEPKPEQPKSSNVRYFRRLEAAAYVRSSYGFPCSPRWLAKLAVIAGGPIFRKAGKTPLYTPADLDAWAQSRIGAPRKSTSMTA
jgi:hypothetical protein